MQTCLVFGHGVPALWDDIVALLNTITQEATFAYTLRALTEEDDFEFEHHGPPLALAADLCLGADNDVELHPQAEPRQRSVSAVAEDPAHTTVDMDLEEAVHAFLGGGGGNPLDRKPAVPQFEFLSLDRDQMLEQHDSHDVFTPEALRDRQIKAMNYLEWILASKTTKPSPHRSARDYFNIAKKESKPRCRSMYVLL